jgi:plasmid stabilization system protein ParE
MEVVRKKLETIQEHPEKYEKKNLNFREAAIKIFPYVIVYTFYKKDGIITVSAIFHTSRNPKRKYRRK